LHRLRRIEGQVVAIGVTTHDREIMILIDDVETDAQPEAIGEREMVVDRIARVDGVFLLMDIARDEVTAVRGDDQPRVGRPRLRAALQQRAERA